jgi:hypothetical protein
MASRDDFPWVLATAGRKASRFTRELGVNTTTTPEFILTV